MRKRRRLADKLTIIVCAVLVVVSAFFYAPMDVEASSTTDSVEYSGTNSVTHSVFTNTYVNDFISSRFIPFSGINPDLYYYVQFGMDFGLEYPSSIGFSNVRNVVFLLNNVPFHYSSNILPDSVLSKSYSTNINYVFKGSDLLSNKISIILRNSIGNHVSFDYDYNISFTLLTYYPLNGVESSTYQQGFNAGYSAGEQVGESNGYSNGYSDGFEAGEQSGYDSGFQAGQDSIDTESYYDMGYSAGYDAGYFSGYDVGYDDGYDAGWQAYEDKISGWGADTSDYPILKYSFFEDRKRLYCDVFTSAPSISYDSALLCYLDFDIDPNHTYKFSVKTGGASGGTTDALYSDFKLNFVIGSNVFNAHNTIGNTFDFFIPGNNMGSTILLEAFVYDCVYYGGPSEEDGFLKNMGQVFPTLIDCYIDIYDMGPSGDTQNHIANQTDQLTGGYNDSQGNSVNNDFSSGINEFETAEDSLFATATTGLKDFTFFDIQSVPAMVTGMSFVGSIMSGWFSQAGGASGVGIVLSILFSIMLVAMVLGLYRWYQSKGGKD